MVGTYCSPVLEEGLLHVDLKDRECIEKTLDSSDPDVVILSGGITNVDLCEERPELTEEVNKKGSIQLVKYIKRRNKKIVFLSTDYVFDGENGPYSEEDSISPINIYINSTTPVR